MSVIGYPEKQDKHCFQIPIDGRNPIPIELYKFKIPVRLYSPYHDFANYLEALEYHLDREEDIVWTDPMFVNFIDNLWIYYKKQQIFYLLYSMVPLTTNFACGFFLVGWEENKSYPEWAKFFSMITCFTVSVLNVYEVLQICASKGNSYWFEAMNYVDILAQIMTQFMSFYNIIIGINDT